MVVSNWPNTINKKFFGFNSKPKENTKLTQFISGRTVAYQANTKKIMTYNFSLSLNNTELAAFWTWFNDDLGQTAGAFSCDALGSNNYRFVSIPEPQDTDTNNRVLSLEVEEVF